MEQLQAGEWEKGKMIKFSSCGEGDWKGPQRNSLIEPGIKRIKKEDGNEHLQSQGNKIWVKFSRRKPKGNQMLKGLDISFQDPISGYYLPALLNILLEKDPQLLQTQKEMDWRGFSLGLPEKREMMEQWGKKRDTNILGDALFVS